MRCRIFVDFWNLTLNWRDRSGGKKLDWARVSLVLLNAAQKRLEAAKLGNLELQETRVYASCPTNDMNLRNWLDNFLSKQTGFQVFVFERKWRQRPIYCRECKTDHANCPSCNSPLGRAVEKGVDARIVTDMLSLAWEDTYDVALLVTSDADMVPAVQNLQARGLKVVNATWRGHGRELARESWVSIEIDNLIDDLIRN